MRFQGKEMKKPKDLPELEEILLNIGRKNKGPIIEDSEGKYFTLILT